MPSLMTHPSSEILVLVVFSAACSSVSGSDPSYWERSEDPGRREFGGFQRPGPDGAAGAGGSAGAGGEGGTAGAGGASTPCALSFQFTTVTYGGRFGPRNVGAVWVMSPENRFVKTLELWATVRANHLVAWNQQTEANRVDVVSSATLTTHRAHECRWDCRDVNGNVVPDGQYKMSVEFTEDNSALFFNPQPKQFSFDFPKISGPTTVTLPDQPNFTKVALAIQ